MTPGPIPDSRRPRRSPVAFRGVLLALALAGVAGCGAATLPVVRTDAERMETARRLAKEGELSGAIGLLKSYIERSAGAADVDDAIYLLGECYLRQKEWTSAQLEFERLLRDYPESDSGGAASFRLGEAFFGQSRGPDFDQEYTHKALAQWLDYRAEYPGHWRATEADQHISFVRDRLARKLLKSADLYVRVRMVGPARLYFERVLTDYGDLPIAGEAELGLARCDRLDGKKAEALARLARIEREQAGKPVAELARRERERTEKMKNRAPARPLPHPIPDSGP